MSQLRLGLQIDVTQKGDGFAAAAAGIGRLGSVAQGASAQVGGAAASISSAAIAAASSSGRLSAALMAAGASAARAGGDVGAAAARISQAAANIAGGASGLSALTTAAASAGASIQSAASQISASSVNGVAAVGRIAGAYRHVSAAALSVAASSRGVTATILNAARGAGTLNQHLRTGVNLSRSLMGSSSSKLTDMLRSAGSAAQRLGLMLRGAEGATSSLTGSIRNMAAAIGLAAAAWKAFDVLKGMVTQGIQFNAMMESSQLGLGALISAMTDITDASGRALSGTEKLNAAMRVAADIQADLRVMALKTAASYDDMVNAIGSAMGPALAAKMDIAKGQIQQFVLAATQMAGAVDERLLRNGQLAQEIRGILEGDTSKNSRLGMILYGDVKGDVRPFVKRLQEEGKFFDYIMEKMEAYSVAGERAANTFSGALSNLKDAIQQALGEGTQGQFGRMTQMLLDMTAKVVTFDEKGKATFNPAFVQSVNNMTTAFVNLASSLAKVAEKLPAIINYIAELASPDKWTVIMALSGGTLGGVLAGPAGAKVGAGAGYLYGAAMQGARDEAFAADNPNADTYIARLRIFNEYLATLDKATQDFEKSVWLKGGAQGENRLRNTPTAFTSRFWQTAGAPTDAVTVTGRAKAVETETDKARQKALQTYKEQLLVFEAQGKALGLQLQISREIDETKRAQLGVDLKVLQALQQQAAYERQVKTDANLTAVEKERLIAESLRNAQKQVAILRNEFEREQTASAQKSAVEAINKAFDSQEALIENSRELTKTVNEKTVEAFREALEKARKPFEDFFRSVGDGMKRAMAAALDGEGLRGMFDEFFASIFDTIGANFAAMIDKWMDTLALAASGQERYDTGQKDAAGNPIFGFRPREGGPSRGAQAGMLALQAGAAAYGLYTNPAPKQSQNMLSGALAGASIGATYGAGVASVYGAIIGAIIGAIAGAFAPTEEGKHIVIRGTGGVFGITGMDGDAVGSSWGKEKLIKAINQAIRGTAAKLDAIFLGLPTAALEALGNWRPNLDEIDVSGKADGKNWNEELDHYLKETLPARVFDAYGAAIQGALRFAGVTDQRLQEFTEYIKNLTVDEAIKATGDYINVVMGLFELLEMFGGQATGGRRRAVGSGGVSPDRGEMFTRNVYANADRGPLAAFEDIAKRVAALSRGFDDLTHEEQVARGQQILDLSQQFFQGVEEYLLKLRDMQRAMNESIDAQLRDIDLDQLTDPQQKVEYLLDEQRRLRDQLGQASTAEEVNDIISRMQQNAAALYDLMGRTPEAAEMIRQQLEDMRAMANARYEVFHEQAEQMLNDAYEMVNSILKRLQEGLDDVFAPPGDPTNPGGGDTGPITPPPEPVDGGLTDFITAAQAATVGINEQFTPSIGDATAKILSFAEALDAARTTIIQPNVNVELGDFNVDVQVSGSAERMIDEVSARAALASTARVMTALEKRAARSRMTGRR